MGYWKQQALEQQSRRAHKWGKPFGWRNPPAGFRQTDALYCYRCCSWRKQDPEHPDKRKYIYSDDRGNRRTAAGSCS